MGAGACQSIIMEGNFGYGVVENFGMENPRTNVIFLLAAIVASCQATFHASLYLLGEDKEDKFTDKYTKPIIDLHAEVVAVLPMLKGTNKHKQEIIDNLTDRLEIATRKTLELFD